MIAHLVVDESIRGSPHVKLLAETPKEWEALRQLIGVYELGDKDGKIDTDLPKEISVGNLLGVRVPLRQLAVSRPAPGQQSDGAFTVPKLREVEKEHEWKPGDCPHCGRRLIADINPEKEGVCPDCGGSGVMPRSRLANDIALAEDAENEHQEMMKEIKGD